MTDETDNHAIRLLREMRNEMREMRGEIGQVGGEMREMRDDLTNRIDGNTIILNMLAGLRHDHEDRIGQLEARK